MDFDSIPETIPCQKCGSKNTRLGTKSGDAFDVHASYACKVCRWISCRSWSRLDRDDYPLRAKCPRCNRWADAYEAGNEGRVVYQHATETKVHQFELEWNDEGWGTYQGRSEIVRVYDTRWDCLAVPA